VSWNLEFGFWILIVGEDAQGDGYARLSYAICEITGSGCQVLESGAWVWEDAVAHWGIAGRHWSRFVLGERVKASQGRSEARRCEVIERFLR
jgi:hypothetical protein